MEQYTIYCTPEQTRKALELGAPIETLDTEVEIENRNIGYTVGYEGFSCQPATLDSYLYDDEGDRKEWCAILEGTEETGRIVVYTPTTEQMRGWLRTKGFVFGFREYNDHISWRVANAYDKLWYVRNNKEKDFTIAELDAIDPRLWLYVTDATSPLEHYVLQLPPSDSAQEEEGAEVVDDPLTL